MQVEIERLREYEKMFKSTAHQNEELMKFSTTNIEKEVTETLKGVFSLIENFKPLCDLNLKLSKELNEKQKKFWSPENWNNLRTRKYPEAKVIFAFVSISHLRETPHIAVIFKFFDSFMTYCYDFNGCYLNNETEHAIDLVEVFE